MNQQIGEMLKRYRKQNNLKVSEVAMRLEKDYNVRLSEKTIYGWESNQAHPTSDVLIALCEIYQVSNVSDMMEIKPAGMPRLSITKSERRLIEEYRLHPEMQVAVNRLLELDL